MHVFKGGRKFWLSACDVSAAVPDPQADVFLFVRWIFSMYL